MDKKVMSIVFPMEIYKKLEVICQKYSMSKVGALKFLVIQEFNRMKENNEIESKE